MVGLTGGIGAGKSAAATRLAARGALIVDSDRIAREVVAPGTEGLREIVATFGDQVLRDDGSLDRPALGALVFADDTARARLEEITHPRVRARSGELIADAPADAVVVNDVPLLVEVGLAPTYHLLLVVEAAEALRVDRLVRDRGMTSEQAYQRIRAQASDARRRAAADVVLVNDGALADLQADVDALWTDRLVPYEGNVREARVARPGAATLVDADSTWPAQFSRLAGRIRHAVGIAEARVDHIGATAVPGLAGTDLIDIQLTVASLTDADALAGRLAEAGFPRCPARWWDMPRSPVGESRGDLRLHGSADPGRPVNLYVREAGSPGWRYALLTRDHLRAVPARRAAYHRLTRLVAGQRRDGPSQSAARQSWDVEEHRLAERWAADTGWRP